MLVTDDAEIHARVSFLRDHGRVPGAFRYFQTTEVGYKYKMSSLQAAFGLAQLERLGDLIDRKRQIFGWYAERLAGETRLRLNDEEPGSLNVYWMVTAVVDAALGLTTRDMMDAFDLERIETRPFFSPLSSLPAFADAPDAAPARQRNTVSYDISPRAINLPSALMLTEAQVDRTCSVLRTILDSAKGGQ